MAKKIILRIGAIVMAVIVAFLFFALGFGGKYYDTDGKYKRISRRSSVSYAMKHPAFEGFGYYIMPWLDAFNRNISVFYNWDFMCMTATYNGEDVVSGLNFIIEQKEKNENLVYSYYSQQERAQDPSKEDANLIFIPGQAGAPVAFVVPGGGFDAYCAIAEGFPIARDLHAKGYNVFVLQYRISIEDTWDEGEEMALTDMGKAIKYVHENAHLFGVNLNNYSIWGFSAGGRMCHRFCIDQSLGYNALGLPMPKLTVLGYSGWYDDSMGQMEGMPATYFSYTKTDKVIGEQWLNGIEECIEVLRNRGVEVGVSAFEKAKHGFGVGKGTDADGWMNNACDFWNGL